MSGFESWSFVDFKEVVALHGHGITLHGGEGGAPKPGCVEGKIGGAISAALYSVEADEEPDLLCAAANLMVYLVLGHCFTDGNKRAAWSATIRVLDLNGIRLNGDDPEAAALVEQIAEHKVDTNGVIAWLGQPGRLHASPARPTPAPPQPTARVAQSEPPRAS